MTFGTETPDLNEDASLTIRPANAASLGYSAPAETGAFATDSALDQLLGLANTELSNVVAFPVTSRPGDFILEFDAIVSEPDIKRYRAASLGGKKRRNAEDADMSVGNAMVMVEKCVGIYQVVGGKRKKIADRDGDDLLLSSEAFLSSFGKGANAHVAVRKFLGDAETNTIGAAVLKAAGWGEDLEPLDPTEA
jgi:hypothetical protein